LNEAGATRLSLVKDKLEGKYYVEKTLIVDIEFQKKLFENEIQVHSSLQHRHIVKFARRTAENSFLMEYASRGNFSSLLNPRPRPPALFKALGEFLKGLAYLHGKGYVHNDIKPSNILLTEERTKLADFAFSGKTGQVTFTEIPGYSMVGTGIYAPENRKPDSSNSVSADLYACGIILYQACSDASYPERINLEKVTDRSAREIIEQCLLGGYKDVETLWSGLQTAAFANRPGSLVALEDL
jgi:serine/threonine protein kinase